MEKLNVECLCCGAIREVVRAGGHNLEAGECSRCGYVGWGHAHPLSEPVRRALRERPPGRRSAFALHAI